MQSTGHFRSSVWDPFLIISQMVAMQCLFYSSLCVWIFSLDLITGSSKSLDQVFRFQMIYMRDSGGAKLLAAYGCNALICAIGLWYFVQRAKQCLDFAFTVHFWHLLFVWLYNRIFPSYLSWWLMQIVCVAVTTVLGEYLCLRTELKAIPVSLGSKVDL